MKRFSAKYLYLLNEDRPLVNGFVEYDDDGTILRTGVCEDPSSEEVFLDGAVIPGFVNAHCHIELSYMWKLFRKGTGMAGFIDQINALRDTASLEDKLADIQTWMDRLWQRGVSAMADISNCADSFAIKAASPMYTRTFLEVFGTEPQDCEAVIRDVKALQAQALACGLDAAPTPHACYTMSPELLTAASAEGLRSGFLSYHSEETQEEEEMLRSGSGPMWENRKRAGMSTPPVTGTSSLLYFLDRLQRVHPAPFGEHILLVHEVCMDQEGIDAVKAVMQHPFIALCPLSNLFIHNALPPVELLRANGMKLTVGTDSLSSNDDLDMVAELFCLQENFPQVPLGEMLGWACRNGAEFLGKEDVLGTIEPGKRPGLVLIDHLSPEGRLTTASASYRIV
ncbi:MAG: amidohydrolase family protein [Bacteroidales bacterium]|nr:amidohydrolase family protein [Bacteroidales bacterium]